MEPLIPDYVQELGRKYVTYELLWNEYRKKFPEGYGYTRFKALIKDYEKAHSYSYHNTYIPGVYYLECFDTSKSNAIDA